MLYECAITTKDNPFNPFDQFDEWLAFDKEKGYDSLERVARLVRLSDDMTEEEVDLEFERAIDRLVEIDFLDIFEKFRRKKRNLNQNTPRKPLKG